MTTRRTKSLVEKEYKIYAYRWEFLRRSPDYLRDFKVYEMTCDRLDRKSPLAAHKYLRRKVSQFLGKYGIAYPLSPTVSFLEPPPHFDIPGLSPGASAEGKKRRRRRKLEYRLTRIEDVRLPFKGAYCLTSDRHVFSVDPNGNVDWDPLSPDEIKRQRTVQVLVNLDAPKEQIMSEVERIVRRWKEMRRSVVPAPKRRIRLEEYDRYLRTYDLRERGRSWEYLAKRFHSNAIKSSGLSYAKRKSKRDYERCKTLIEGGYRQIR